MFRHVLRMAAGVACVLIAVTLGACGGGGESTASSKAAAEPATATTTASAGTPRGTSITGHYTTVPSSTSRSALASQSRASSAAGSAQFKRALGSFAACLSAHGVKLPSAGGSGAAPGLSLKGVDTKSPAYRRALAACVPVINAALKAATKARSGSTPPSAAGGGSAGARPTTGASPGIGSVKIPASVTAGYERFTACMRSNGVAGFPEPEGASFNISGAHLDTHSPQYKAAEARCDPILMAVDSGG